MLDATDDLRHPLGDDPAARESMVWNIVLPDRDTYAIGYFTMTAAAEATRLLVVFDTDGTAQLDIAADEPLEGSDLDDFTVAGMRIAQPERLQAMTVDWTGEKLGLDYRFDAIHEAFDFARNADGCPPVAATNRFEQAGRIGGVLRVGGEAIEFDTTGHRDHSWGVRDYGSILHWKWISAQCGPGLAFHAMHTWFQGRQYTNGYVFRDGLLSPLVELGVRATYDAEVMQREGEFTLVDEAGRRTAASCEYFAGGFLPFAGVAMAEAGCRFEIAGEAGVGVFEQGWQPAYLEHLRSGRALTRV